MNSTIIHQFRLYVAGNSPNSQQARRNLELLCAKHLAGCHQIEVVDVLKDPDRALEDEVLLAPTLIRLSPAPPQFLLGNLSDTATVLASLGLGPPTE